MKTSVKTTRMTLTPQMSAQIDKVCVKLGKVLKVADPEALSCKIEVGCVTRHHRKGDVFRAEINVAAPGIFVRATAAAESVLKALNEAFEEVRREALKAKKKKVSVKHREGVEMKKASRRAR